MNTKLTKGLASALTVFSLAIPMAAMAADAADAPPDASPAASLTAAASNEALSQETLTEVSIFADESDYFASLTTMSEAGKAALKAAYQELDHLFDVHSGLYDDAGDVKPGMDAQITETLDQIDALYEKIAGIYTDAGLVAPFLEDTATVALSDEDMARLDSAYGDYEQVFAEWSALFDEDGLVTRGSEAKEAGLAQQMTALQADIDAIYDAAN